MKNQTKQEKLKALSVMNGYQKRKERVKTCNGNFIFELDDENNYSSYSYEWWTILKNINGLYFFNKYNYSSTTRKHQWAAHDICAKLKLNYIEISFREDMAYFSLEKFLIQKIENLIKYELSELFSVQNKNASNRLEYNKNNYLSELNDYNLILSKMPKNAEAKFFKLYNEMFLKFLSEKLDEKLDKYWHGVDLRNKKIELKNSTENEIDF